ncbi:MAG: hypothetical protein ACYSU7_13090 [Planctomycetota bacterium]|jgi:hypothetical protein
MMRIRPYRVCAPILAAAMLALASCGGSSESDEGAAGPAEGGDAAAKSTAPVAGGEPGPPDDYVPWECSVCSCRVFTGEGATCNRPACQHHWSDHQRPPQ